MLFVQQDAVLGPELDPPAARAFAGHDALTKGAVTVAWTGLNAERDGLVQPIVPIPAMLDRRCAGGLDLRVEEQGSRRYRSVRRIACKVLEVGAEPRLDHRQSRGR